MTKYIFFAGGMEEGNRDMKIRSTAVMSTSALTWRSSCPGVVCKNSSELLPYGIYTIPEISMVGKTEAQLTDAKIPYEVGIAKYEELAKGQILGDGIRLLKILFDPGTLRVLGVTLSARMPPRLFTSGKQYLALAPRSNTFAIRCLTTRLWRKPTSWRPWTG
jgi:hypothetical protein